MIHKSNNLPFLVQNTKFCSLNLIDSRKSVPPGQAPRGRYINSVRNADSVLYIKNNYPKNKSLQNSIGTSEISLTTKFGEFSRKIIINKLIYNIQLSSLKSCFLFTSFDYTINKYTNEGDKQISRDFEFFPTDIWEQRCLEVSNNSKNILYSLNDTLFKLDQNLNTIFTWEAPVITQSSKPIFSYLKNDQKHSENIISDYMKWLNLESGYSNEELKTAFRNKMMLVHPDLNPKDPNANEKTRKTLTALDLLSKEEYRLENRIFGKETESSFSFALSISTFSQVPDMISSICTNQNENNLFIGTSHGKLFLLDSSNSIELVSIFSDPIRYIKSSHNKTILVFDDHLLFLNNREIIHKHEMSKEVTDFKIDIIDNFCFLFSKRYISLFNLGGEILGSIIFKNTISDGYIQNEKMKIISPKEILTFAIQKNL